MSETIWVDVFLGVIAVATGMMAAMQVGAMLVAARLARRVERLAEVVEQELKPILGNLSSISRDASRATALAAAQVERVDELFADISTRVEQSMEVIQSSILAPAREGRAVLAGLRAAMGAIRDLREDRRRARPSRDDDDALFI